MLFQINHKCENKRINDTNTIYRKVYRVENPKLLAGASKQNQQNTKIIRLQRAYKAVFFAYNMKHVSKT